MKNEHWTASQLGDFPYHRFRRRASDRAPQDLPHPIWVLLSLLGMLMAVFGLLEIASRLHR